MARIAPAVRVSYQGIACKSGSFSCPYGAASGHGHVVMPQTEFVRRIGGDPWLRHGQEKKSGVGATEVPESGGAPKPLSAALRSPLEIRGSLVFERTGQTVVLPRIYVSDAGVEDATRSAEERDLGLVRVPLVDVRYLWSRGDFHGEYNMLASRTGVRAPRAAHTMSRDEAGEIRPETKKPGGEPYTLLDLVKLCLRRLPGGITLVEGPETTVADGIIPVNLDYRGESAARVLQGLIDAWNFRFVYDPVRDQATLFRFNSGRPSASEQGGKTLTLTFPTLAGEVGIAPGSIPRRMRSTQHFLRPKAVRVVGKPIIREAKAPLELCGDVNGEVVPLDAALAFYGVTRADAARFVLLPKDAQKRWAVNLNWKSFAADEVNRWAFRWARLAGQDRDFLPILPYRARAMVDGARRKPVVWADYFDETSFRGWILYYEEKLREINEWATRQIEAMVAEFDAATQAVVARELERARLRGEFGLVEFIQEWTFHGRISTSPAADRVALALARETEARILRDLQHVRRRADFQRAKIASSEERELRRVNRFCDLVNPAAYQVEPEEGVVKFNRLIGHIDHGGGEGPVTRLGPPADRTQYVIEQSSLLLDEPCMHMLFAYVSSPARRKAAVRLARQEIGIDEEVEALEPDDAIDRAPDRYRDHFNYLGALGTDGKAKRLNEGGIDPKDAAEFYPRAIRHDLQQYVDFEGRTNAAELETFAATVVRRESEGDEQAVGERGESATFWPIHPTGAVSVVEWEVTPDGRARTRWTVGVERAIEARQQTQLRIRGGTTLTGAGSELNPEAGGEGKK